MAEHDVLIVGGGPTGMMLAAELAIAGIDVAIVERRLNRELEGSRAGGLHARTIEELDQRGVAERFIAEGTKHTVVHFHIPLDLSDFPSRHNYVLGLWQKHIERILGEWVNELGVKIHRGQEVTGFTQSESAVDVQMADGSSMRAQYLVGCDGGRSLVRKVAGIDFPGWDPTTSWLIAEVDWTQEPEWGMREDARGIHGIGKLDDGKRARVLLVEENVGAVNEPTLRDISEGLTRIYGTDFGIHNPSWVSRFTDMTRQAASYRDRRVLLAGDAAHVHAPVGGQGLNIGVQDATNLGWKLAQVVKSISTDSLLDTYHAERHPVGARVLKNTMAQMALRRTDDRTKALGEYVAQLVGWDGPRKQWVAEISGLGVRYDLGEGHPLLGRRMPDLDVVTPDGVVRVFTLLHDAKPVMLNFGEPPSIDITPWSDRVKLIDAKCDGAWELPALGPVSAPRAVLLRPDGYVAWVGAANGAGLVEALTKWFGAPSVRR
jgi:3-(3-hydroxy-phenyl)propionate hydroxylase